MKANLLPVVQAAKLRESETRTSWLVQGIWTEQAVGIIGGEPKSFKSFMALTLAIAVASGKPCLGRFEVDKPGKVLLYPAEDSLSIVRKRLEGIASNAGLELGKLPLYVTTTTGLRLDVDTDRQRLRNTVEKLRPKLLILDPFVRLHNIDENASGEVAQILGHLRSLQRSFGVAVALVHHAKKGAAKTRAGQALRGSSEFHAWGDSNIYLQRTKEHAATLTLEHRAEPSPETMTLELAQGDQPHLRILAQVENNKTTESSAKELVYASIADSPQPLGVTQIRALLTMRNEKVTQAILQLIAEGRVAKTNGQYHTIPHRSRSTIL